MPLVSLTLPRRGEVDAVASAHALDGRILEHGEQPTPVSGAHGADQPFPHRWAVPVWNPRLVEARPALVEMRPARGRFERAMLALRHLLFSCGVSDAARLRGWARWDRWRRHATPGQRAREALGLARLPVRAAWAALAGIRQYGDEVHRQAGVSRPRQFAQLWWLRVAYGIKLDAYITFQLYRPERYRQASRYIQVDDLTRVYRLLNGRTTREEELAVIVDKRKFDTWCRAHGLPSAPTLLEVEGGRVTNGREALAALPPVDLFSKPADMSCGRGACRWRYDGRGYVGQDGRSRSPEELAAELEAMSLRLKRAVIVQECLRNHRSLAALTSGALSTVRIMTYRPLRGTVLPLLAAYRMPVGQSVVDNVAQGGSLAHVDLATGRLGQAVLRRAKLFEAVERHPDTNAWIEGTQLPFWKEAVDLVVRAHEVAGSIVAIGWDVALLDDGPVLIEGNSRASSRIMQLASGIPLADRPLLRVVHEHLRESFGM